MVYSRYPHLHRDNVVFVADDDLWLGPLSGGRAARITLGEAAPRNPRFSPDGNRIAFTSTTEGGWDAYVVELDGGTRRLTWLSAGRMLVSGWLDDDHILLCSDHQAVHRTDARLYSLSLDGHLERLPWGAATAMELPSFKEKYGHWGTVVSAVPLVWGIAGLAGQLAQQCRQDQGNCLGRHAGRLAQLAACKIV